MAHTTAPWTMSPNITPKKNGNVTLQQNDDKYENTKNEQNVWKNETNMQHVDVLNTQLYV